MCKIWGWIIFWIWGKNDAQAIMVDWVEIMVHLVYPLFNVRIGFRYLELLY